MTRSENANSIDAKVIMVDQFGGPIWCQFGGPLTASLTPPNPSREPLIWHGERDIARVINQAGEWNSNYSVDNMFDDSATTLWHSSRAMQSKPKVIGFEFKVKTFSLRD